MDSNDLAWDGESKRIIAVGDGKERYVFLMEFKERAAISNESSLVIRFAYPFMIDTGTSCGEVTGHSKASLDHCSFGKG